MRLEAQGLDRGAVLNALDRARAEPEALANDPVLGPVATEFQRRVRRSASLVEDTIREQPVGYGMWGREGIDEQAIAQMDLAMRLPVSVAGALMPDAHVGYGLPIGGVLATESAVIPFAVGVDIACRMRLSLYPVSPIVLGQMPERYRRALMERTLFGPGAAWRGNERAERAVLEDEEWAATPILRALRDKARGQLGASGSGNHFVEWGAFTLGAPDPRLGLEVGTYLALLSHSGSRGVGFKIANTYSKIAEERRPGLDARARRLAWLDMESHEGQEYWLSMELAGRFASANHAVIHHRVAAAVENHHNFAWREQVRGPSGEEREVIVHRKGATPAGAGVLGIIPGSMADAGYLIRGRGAADALDSASHGAGRAMSRTAALQSVTKTERDRYLRQRGVTLLGGGLDEAPQAYKRVEQVIAAQSDLVEIMGGTTFRP
ncbi:MAG TPA: RtcB family protein [Chloroflexota bacterium]|nr:RtcB family protein [Chloroflexota bacterium]